MNLEKHLNECSHVPGILEVLKTKHLKRHSQNIAKSNTALA